MNNLTKEAQASLSRFAPMTNEQGPGEPAGTNITSEMRGLFLALGVDRVKCYECNSNRSIESVIWDNGCMWFVCPGCKKEQETAS
jgi:hypothetical protein